MDEKNDETIERLIIENNLPKPCALIECQPRKIKQEFRINHSIEDIKIFKKPSEKRQSRKPQKLADEQEYVHEKACTAAKRALRTPRSRILKTQTQYDELNKEMIKGGHFGFRRVDEIATRLGLTRNKVYKWFWDRKSGYLAKKYNV